MRLIIWAYQLLLAGMVDVQVIEPAIHVDLMYAGRTNVVGRALDGYVGNVCFLTPAAARALADAQARLRARAPDHALLVRDCYRPQRAVDELVAWAAATDPELLRQGYIAAVSGHTRGTTVDLTIVDGAGRALDMGTEVDAFDPRSHTAFAGLAPAPRANRRLLLDVMRPGFKNFAKEWWHFTLR